MVGHHLFILLSIDSGGGEQTPDFALDHMDSEPDRKLARSIADAAQNPRIQRQLHRFPVFAVPEDTQEELQDLLKQLEEADAKGNGRS